MIATPGLGDFEMKSILLALVIVGSVFACDPPPQGPQQVTYQNGYAQQGPARTGYGTAPSSTVPTQPITYSPADPAAATASPTMTVIAAPTATVAQAAPPVEIQTTPVPLGVQPLPLPSATTTAAPQQTQSWMATPGTGAFQCTSDAQCLLGKCNVQFGRCAYPCKSTENDCKAGNVCTASGVCLPKAAAGIKM
jgi:hypothetical protein